MNILHRYIAKTIILTSLIVIFAILALSFFIGLLGELRDIGSGDYGFPQALVHVLLRLPHDLYQFFPMLVLLGGVIGLGILAAHHELIVMRTSGVSMKRMVMAVMSAAFFLILLATLLGECIAPHSIYLAVKYKDSAQNSGQAVATASGLWVHEGNNFLHVDRVTGRHHLEGVKRYEFNDQHQLLAVYQAKSIDYEEGEWVLHDYVKTTFKGERTESQRGDIGYWNLALNPNLLNIGVVEPRELSLPHLSNYSQHLLQNKVQASRFQFEFWKRVFQPIMTLVMILLAIPFVFAAPRSVTMGWRILFSILIGFIFYTLNAFLGQFSVVFQVTPWLAALFPSLLFAGVGYILMLKIKG